MIEKITLENRHVRLEPLSNEHADGLWLAAQFEDLWNYMPFVPSSKEHIDQFIAFAKKQHAAGQALVFATIESGTGKIVGSTGFWNADLQNRRVEIGYTWISPSWQRTAINTSTKYLMMQHAFEELELNRVEFKTDSLNTRSQAALQRIGAKQEGTLRMHMVQPDGRLRDSVYFSVVRPEWTDVQIKLRSMLDEPLVETTNH